MTTKSIGSAGGRDYATPALWLAGCPSNLVTSTQTWEGECYNDSEFSGTGNRLNITGKTTNSTYYIELRCATGQSFKDNAGVRSNALFPNVSNGVMIRTTNNAYNHAVTCSVNFTRFVGLQVQHDETSGGDSALYCGTSTGIIIDSCICRGGTGGFAVSMGGKIKNSLCISRSASRGGLTSLSASAECHGCTVVQTAATPTSAGIALNYNGILIKNTAVFGFNSFNDNTASSSSDYNASDKTIANGTHNQASLTFSSQFTSTTTDFRAVSTGSLDLNGTPDSTNLPTDISVTTRSASTPTIGCWEVTSAPAGRTTFNTRSHPLGVRSGINFRVAG